MAVRQFHFLVLFVILPTGKPLHKQYYRLHLHLHFMKIILEKTCLTVKSSMLLNVNNTKQFDGVC